LSCLSIYIRTRPIHTQAVIIKKIRFEYPVPVNYVNGVSLFEAYQSIHTIIDNDKKKYLMSLPVIYALN